MAQRRRGARLKGCQVDAELIEAGGNADDALVRDGLARDARAAYDAYENRLTNAWCDEQQRWRSGDLDEFGADAALQRRGESLARTRDGAVAATDHYERMAALYAIRDRELENAWRCGK